MANYTDEEIIAYLKTLKEGDVLIAVEDDKEDDITKGKSYKVRSDGDGDLEFTDDFPYDRFINVGKDYQDDVFELFKRGLFEIPTKSTDKFYVEISDRGEFGDSDTALMLIYVDKAGHERMLALEKDSVKTAELAALYEQQAELQRKIDALTKE